VIVPKDQSTLTNVLKEAKKAGIKVVSYDRLIKSPDVDVYISFDNERVGTMQGEALMKAMPNGGNVYVLSGDPGDNNAKLFKAGAMKAMEPQIKAGKVKILGEQAVKDWLAANALTIAENALTQHQNKIDGFLGPNDMTAGGIIQALAGQKLAGKVPVTGQDADLAACKRIIAGTQTMTVYKSLNLIATEAAKLSIALIKGDAVKYKAEKAEGGANQILLDPIVITKDNVDFLVKDGFYTKEQLGN
jgi:D-xylose transport system substrate-binding protein